MIKLVKINNIDDAKKYLEDEKSLKRKRRKKWRKMKTKLKQLLTLKMIKKKRANIRNIV